MRELSPEEIEEIRRDPDGGGTTSKRIVDWDRISWHKILSEDFIREFQHKVVWVNISFAQVLSEEFIRKFQDKVNWNFISSRQRLSEDFIREFKDKVYWPYISYYQNLSKEFYIEFYDKINWQEFVDKNKHEHHEYFKDLPGYVKLHIALNYRDLSKYL